MTISAITYTKFIIYAIIFGEVLCAGSGPDDLDGHRTAWLELLIERLSGKFNESNFSAVMSVKQL